MSDFTKLHRLERVAGLNGASTRARAVWSLAHHALDRRGRMHLGGAEWQSVLVRRLGVDTSERQWFYAGLRELERLGLATVQGEEFVLGGHAGADEKPARKGGKQAEISSQDGSPFADLFPTSSRRITDVSPTSSGPSADLQPTYHGRIADLRPASERNHSETVPRARVQNREEENRIEVDTGEKTNPPEVDHEHVVKLYSRLRSEAHRVKTGQPGGTYRRGPRDWQPVEDLVAWAREQTDPAGMLEDSLRGFLADEWAIGAGWPISTWAKDPGRYNGRLPARGMAQEAPDELGRLDDAVRRARLAYEASRGTDDRSRLAQEWEAAKAALAAERYRREMSQRQTRGVA